MSFGDHVLAVRRAGGLVVQPRMGFGDPAAMRAGLLATKAADATTVGTITLDSFTRVNDLESVAEALRAGRRLNGYPIVSHPEATTRGVLDGIEGPDFPVQVRHGSARPADIMRALVRVGLSATEGGPVSYCLPYSRTPLDESVRNWELSCALLLEAGSGAHLETFGGCMMGQLCPPSLLVALSALEAAFFHQQGLRSISVSYAQQTHLGQDQEAVLALRELCSRLLPDTRWHVVVYAYMGLYPRTRDGALRLLARAVELAMTAGAARVIVKTESEAHRIPTVAENVTALEHAASAARLSYVDAVFRPGQVYWEAKAIVDAVLGLDGDVGRALVTAFKTGLLDVPYCLHPDNANRSRSAIDPDGRLAWSELGALPLHGIADVRNGQAITSSTLLSSLSYVQETFDLPLLEYTVGSLDRRGTP